MYQVIVVYIMIYDQVHNMKTVTSVLAQTYPQAPEL